MIEHDHHHSCGPLYEQFSELLAADGVVGQQFAVVEDVHLSTDFRTFRVSQITQTNLRKSA